MSTVTPFTPQSQQPPSQVSSSSPVPPTIPPSLTTQNLDPQTALSATPGSPSPYTSLFPSTDSTPRTETIKTLTSSISPTDNTSIAVSPETPRVVTDETTTQDVTTALKPMETETPEMSTARERTESTLVGTRFIQTPAPTIDNAPSTTSPITLLTTPSQSTTQEMSRDIVKTTTVAETTHRDLTTEEPKTTVSRKPLPYPTPAGTTPAVKRITTAMTAPTTTHLRIAPTTAASPCASSPCHNGGQCVESGDTRSYSCDCPPAWSGHLCTKGEI
ncbi:hypothetical protein GDO81_030031 [Engystomops pustulosus]|uniref:EGF-like domain-containing protein n=1 Tax=Engystomops pustulosus TaxID=76066 RepID=A0AAV6ZB97_ENGPU|nr:hypothetical protein GDO81_030031 [Engystomops pustulosus]